MVQSLTTFGYAIIAQAHAALIMVQYLFHDQIFLGFAGGVLIAILVIAFILTGNPRTIPFILRYSFPDCFHRANDHFEKNQIACDISMERFHKIYVRMQLLLGTGLALFVSIAIAAVYLQ
jgi:hypothetical protein